MRNPGDILLLSCYELGHQPLSLAWPLAFLQQAGFHPHALDLAVQPFDLAAAQTAQLVAIAVPMHTALRIGLPAARQVRAVNPTAHVVCFGLYAWLNADYLLADCADSVIAGEYEQPLVALAQALTDGQPLSAVPGLHRAQQPAAPNLERLPFITPQRASLPAPQHYAHLQIGAEQRLAGYVEASRGCLHTCRHCPIPPVYQGRFFVVPAEVVLADVRQQVAAGVRHITFGDPDFLNGPGHALRLLHALHAKFPDLTFDFTAKVEHLLRHADLLPEFAANGVAFIVSAFESVSDRVLTRLSKGHTRAEMERLLALARAANVPLQPTWMPFTPWTTLADYLDLLDWIRAQGLIPNVPAVQLAIRMLVPPGSALLNHPDVETWCGPLDAENFVYRWAHPDPRMDALQAELTALAATAPADPYDAFQQIEAAAYAAAGLTPPAPYCALPDALVPPRLTENWFC